MFEYPVGSNHKLKVLICCLAQHQGYLFRWWHDTKQNITTVSITLSQLQWTHLPTRSSKCHPLSTRAFVVVIVW